MNKIHSMQYRILATVIFAMLVITVCIGGTSIYEVDRYIQEESRVLADMVQEIEIYENGFAYLEMDGVVIHSDDREFKTENQGDLNGYLRVSEKLTNGMTLVLSASYDDVQQIRFEISLEIFVVSFMLSVFFIAAAIAIVRRIVAPLERIADASVKISNGDYNVEFVHSNVSEIQLLNTAFKNMATRLHEREEELRFFANRDSLTGLRNTTAYKSFVEGFDKEIADKDVKFGVVVFDVNRLKETNDEYGHDVGDKLIATVAKVISDTFKRSPVFRIGGDEFLAVLQHRDLEDREKLFKQLDLVCANTFVEGMGKMSISIARGIAMFDSDKDLCFNDVFKRADYAMYENKRKTKEVFTGLV